ncbi:MAG TPA: MBL fold metallo-hydrolase [Chloroflexota bacterium]|nr:MBL fold metallo-hydrolase [Chloroflexota bacterium]
MEIVWLGHSCFRLKGRDTTVITDPFDRSSGYSLGKVSADLVTVSHTAPDHSNVAAVDGNPQVVDGPGEYEVRGVLITGVATRRDGEKGRNTAYLMEIDDLTVCHLGDLGHILTPPQVEQMNSADILLIPVGGNNTINASQAAEVISQIEPRIVIPMHFKTEATTLELDPISKFQREMGLQELKPQPRLVVSKGSLPEETTVVLLDYKR